jgi:L-threonylcarbamoyladenylate synthase
MRIVRIDRDKPRLDRLKEAAAVLKRGGLVVYPTETAYALGCDAMNRRAIARIYGVKRRESGKPLPLIAGNVAQVRRVAKIDPISAALAGTFWPGPLTLVLKAKAGLPKGVVSGSGEIGVRVSGDVIARRLAELLGRPIVSTSANRSGNRTPYRLVDILDDVGARPDFCLDAGELPPHLPSTVVRCFTNGACEILRPGPVGAETIQAVLNERL